MRQTHNYHYLKLFLLALLMSSLVFCGPVTKVASASGQFLKIGIGARATAMGNTFSAVANDITSIYWNPAGLARLNSNQLFVSHIDWLADIDYDAFAVASRGYSLGSVGLFATSLRVPEEEVRTVLQPEGTGEFFEAGDIAIGFAYSRAISDYFSIGFVGKVIQETIWSMSSTAVAMDIGTIYRADWMNLQLGIVLSNFGTKTKLAGRANLLYVDPDPTIEGNIESIRAELEMNRWNLPLNLKTSLALVPIKTATMQLMTAVDMIHPNDNTEYFNLGTELQVMKMFFLRGGYHGLGMDHAEGGPAFGGGLLLPVNTMQLHLDYATMDFGRLDYIHQFSLGVEF